MANGKKLVNTKNTVS